MKIKKYLKKIDTGVILCFIGFLALIPLHGCSKRAQGPNVVLLTLDTLRADALACYGNKRVQTPNLDRLASEGVLFEDAVCQIPATLTSHTAMMTGRNPKTTGVRFRTANVSPLEETLAERFQTNGYQTAAFISSYVLAPEFGLNQGFDLYDLGSLRQGEKKNADERRAEETIDDAIAYLEERGDRPFFLWIHLYDPHSPYEAPLPYTTMYDPEYQGSLQGTVAEITRLNANNGRGAAPRDLEHLRARYEGEVTYMDRHIGRLLSALEKKKLLDRTVVAALADHGENLGEGGRYFHGDDLYQPAVHIPFLIRYPKKIAAGKRINQLAQSIDLFPTLLELTDIPTISGIEGKSLLPLIDASNSNGSYKTHPGYLETEADPFCEGNKLYGLRTERHKFIYHAAQRRTDVPLGVFAEIPLKGPTLVMLRIKGDPAVRLMAHIRYRTRDLYQSRNFQKLATLNTTVVHAETPGVEPLQRQAMEQKNFYKTPDGWRLQMTPDLYRIARNYGRSQGWPVDWMVLEGVGVDASLPVKQNKGTFTVDGIELYAPSLRFPKSPRYRNPFWVLEDFESGSGMRDAGEGAPHTIQSTWKMEDLFGGRRQQKVTIVFNDDIDLNKIDELFDLAADPNESGDLLNQETLSNEITTLADSSRNLLDAWIAKESGIFAIEQLDGAQLEALQALGYTR